MHIKFFLVFCAISGLVIANSAMASSWRVHLNMGAGFSRLSNNSTVSTTTGLTNTYNVNKSLRTGFFFGVGADYTVNQLAARPFALSLGVSTYFIGLGHISGTEVPGSNIGLTDLLDYRMNASSLALLFEPRFAYTAYRLQPYLLLGVGVVFNTLSGFRETTPAGSSAAPSNPYRNHTEAQAAFEVGAGWQYPFHIKRAHFLAHLEYRYLDMGNAKLGAAANQTTRDRLTSKNISAHILDIGLGYLF